eukprot:SAG11_NODE_897_length_6637_cov_8.510320_1_plen_215_part_00
MRYLIRLLSRQTLVRSRVYRHCQTEASLGSRRTGGDPKGFPPAAHFRSHTIHRGRLDVNPMSGRSAGNISLPASWLPAYKARWVSRIRDSREQPRCPFCARKKTVKSFSAISVVEVGQLTQTDAAHGDPHSIVATARSLGYDAVGLFADNCQQWQLLDEYIAAASALGIRVIANLESYSTARINLSRPELGQKSYFYRLPKSGGGGGTRYGTSR